MQRLWIWLFLLALAAIPYSSHADCQGWFLPVGSCDGRERGDFWRKLPKSDTASVLARVAGAPFENSERKTTESTPPVSVEQASQSFSPPPYIALSEKEERKKEIKKTIAQLKTASQESEDSAKASLIPLIAGGAVMAGAAIAAAAAVKGIIVYPILGFGAVVALVAIVALAVSLYKSGVYAEEARRAEKKLKKLD